MKYKILSKEIFKSYFFIIIFIIINIIIKPVNSANPEILYNRIKPFINDNCSIKITSNNNTLLSINENTMLKPASIIKILSSYYFIKMLGTDFRFYTDFFFDGKNLYLKGYGDPLFISEEIEKVAINISKVKRKFQTFYIDSTFFEKPIVIPGVGSTLRPFDTQNGAVVSNFNTIKVNITRNQIISGEKQTPITPLSETIARRSRLNGLHRMNIGVLSDCIDFGEIYTGELITHFLRENNVRIESGVYLKSVPPTAAHIYRHFSSFKLTDVIENLLKYSNNFITNQIGLYICGRNISPPANQSRSIQILYNFLSRNHRDLLNIELKEFSGISWDNLITAKDMNTILNLFEPYKHLLPEKNGFFYKTGTLTNVRSIAGYYVNENGKQFNIVIMLNDNVTNLNRIINIIKQELNKI